MGISPTTCITSRVRGCTGIAWKVPALICLLSSHKIRNVWGNEKGSNETVLVSMTVFINSSLIAGKAYEEVC